MDERGRGLGRDAPLHRENIPHLEKWHEDRFYPPVWANRRAGLRLDAEEYGVGGTFARERETRSTASLRSAVDTFTRRCIRASSRRTFYVTAPRNRKKRWLPKLAAGELVGAIAKTSRAPVRPARRAHDRTAAATAMCSTARRLSSQRPARQPDHRRRQDRPETRIQRSLADGGRDR